MYQHQFFTALCRQHDVFPYGPGHPGHSRADTVQQVLARCPFSPDLICFGAGWEFEGPWGDHPTESDPQPSINAGEIDIPAVQILNKEYKKLDRKFEFIRRNRIQAVFTVHHNWAKWQGEIAVRFVHFPFAVDPDLFHDYGEAKRYDLGFSGNLHVRWTDLRRRLKDRIFWKEFRLRLGNRTIWLTRIRRPHFMGRRIYWGEWGLGSKTGEDYARLINSSLIWLNTTSAIDIVGPRFFEAMAAKSLLLCNRSPAYEGLFNEGEHCAMFEPDLSDFEGKVDHFLGSAEEREEIVARAHEHVLRHHTWDVRVEQFTAVAEEILAQRPVRA
jgi:spore maturation protein CgeB